MKHTLFVIDAYNLIYRMFYALPEMKTRKGEQVNALFGIAKFIKGLASENPDAQVVVATDVGKSFRADMYADYKWERDRMPDNLRAQVPAIESLFHALWIPILSEEWYEADDIIGSIATQHADPDTQVVIISSDKDLCQFVVDGKVHVYDAMKRKFLKESDVLEKFWVPVSQVRDYLAIVGDVSDNIPGIAGFGPKKAQELLSRYGSLEAMYDDIGIDDMESDLYDIEKYEKSELSEKVKSTLKTHQKIAFLSQKLATIDTGLSLPPRASSPLKNLSDSPAFTRILRTYEFTSLLPKESNAPPHVIQVPIESVDTPEGLISLLEAISQKKDPLVLAHEGMDILIGYGDRVYRVDAHLRDHPLLRSAVLAAMEAEKLVAYDLKWELTMLLQ